MLTSLILGAALCTALLLLWPRLSRARLWRATVTPLASIIGSGFLVLGPILESAYGIWAPAVMAALCLGAWLFGAAVRVNIARRARGPRSPAEERLESGASWALAFAYVISVAYYLNLFGAFGTRLTPWNDPLHAKLLTSAMFLLVLGVGWTRGFSALERMEQIAVGLKLAIIAGLLAGLAAYFWDKAETGALLANPPTLTGWAALTLGFGLIVTVQGFETTRYLGAEYTAPTRIRAMKLAQGLSALIYMAYIGLIAYVFPPGTGDASETAIIGLMGLVAPILPLMLTGAALAAQFSAAVADTGGAGGLVEELTRRRIRVRSAYALLVGLGLALTWTLDVFEIIAFASRAFALYYALQAGIAALGARAEGQTLRARSFEALALLGLVIAVFGAPVE
ncbi:MULTISPECIES: APC family permease [unclassified Salipiger]|uniref:APC family permease n=1 Tax=unclassified Salipiger TaxID=2640570 RepID=UPI0013BE51B4|nr:MULTISPECIES: APC family permease [unclassified Salipiger]NDV49149.1 APC family permease [Salipiger sp. PrR003]NDW31409.1 APC family permease [Salipiger sp. PrR007]